MTDEHEHRLRSQDLRELIDRHTPARLFVDRRAPSYATSTQLQLRQDHALAVDAVQKELDWRAAWPEQLIQELGIFELSSSVQDKSEYLLRPDRGRILSNPSRETLRTHARQAIDVQFVIGDGLSAAAVATQIPDLLPMLITQARIRRWAVGPVFVVRYCRVALMNEIGEILRPEVVLLLIGERPGLATAQSLSAYLAYRPDPTHSDAQRNLISNIHPRGVTTADAAERIIRFVELLRMRRCSGFELKEPGRDDSRR